MLNPDFLIADFGKFDRPAYLHLAFQALHHFKSAKGHLPRPGNQVTYLTSRQSIHAVEEGRGAGEGNEIGGFALSSSTPCFLAPPLFFFTVPRGRLVYSFC